MSEQKKPDPTVEAQKLADDNRPFADVQPFKERLYDQIKIPVWVLDIIIVLLIIAVVACVILGMQKGSAL